MKKLHMAMLAFWNSFEWNGKQIPAFPAGCVPPNQPFPYFTFETPEGAYFSFAMPSTWIWCRTPENGSSAAVQCAEILDAVAQAIPEEGRMLTFDGGAVWLKRNDAQFLNWWNSGNKDSNDSPTGEDVVGGRISLCIQYFVR